MPRKGGESCRNRHAPRRLRERASSSRQYSLFAATTPDGDAGYFRRQAQLCERLIAGLHQRDLVEELGRLHEEFAATAELMSTPAHAAEAPSRGPAAPGARALGAEASQSIA